MQKKKTGYLLSLLLWAGVSFFYLPGCTPDYMNLGDTLLRDGKYVEALDSFSKARVHQGSNWLVYNKLGWSYYHLGRYNEAVDQFKLSLDLQDNWDTHRGLGQAYHYLKRYAEGLPHLLKFKAAQPGNWQADSYLGWAYHHLARYEEAIGQFKTALALAENWGNHLGLGQSYFMAKRYNEALHHLLKFKEAQSENQAAYKWLGWTYHNLGRDKEAITQYLLALNLEKNWGTYQDLGKSYFMMNELDPAVTAFKNALALAPAELDREHLKVAIANCYVLKGDYQGAYEVLGPKPYLGVELKATSAGIMLVGVTRGSPAGLAGLQAGDTIARFDGIETKNIPVNRFVEEIVWGKEFGSMVSLELIRDGLILNKNLSIGITPEMASQPAAQLPAAKGKEQSKRLKLAVLDFEAVHGIEDSLAFAMSDYLRDEIHALGKYEVLSRDDLTAIAKRASLQQQAGTCADTSCLVEFGKALGTEFMVAGSISKVGTTYSISLRLLDTEGQSAGVKKRVNERCQCSEDELFDAIKTIAGKIAD